MKTIAIIALALSLAACADIPDGDRSLARKESISLTGGDGYQKSWLERYCDGADLVTVAKSGKKGIVGGLVVERSSKDC